MADVRASPTSSRGSRTNAKSPVNEDLERVVGEIPGPQTRALTAPLLAHESRNVTYVGEDFPVFWKSASGATVVDVDG